MTYNLNENVAESFDFDLNGHKYVMRYLTGEERKKLAELTSKIEELSQAADKVKDDEDQTAFKELETQAKTVAEEMRAKVDTLVTPENPESPNFQDQLEKATAPVVREFQRMMQTEQSFELPTNQGASKRN